jgi:CTP synthase
VNNAYRDALSKAGLRFSGTSPDGRLVEFIELDRELHPFFVATQAHPELKSRPTRPHPLFAAFVKAVVAYSAADKLPVDLDPSAASELPAGAEPAASADEAPTRAAGRGGASSRSTKARSSS